MDALRVDKTLVIEGDALSVSFTRELEHSGPEAARHAPTHVELRFDVRNCEALSDEQKSKIIGTKELKANRRGTIRVFCREHRTRKANLDGARQELVAKLRAVLFPQPEDQVSEEPPPRPKRGGGLIKKGG